MSMQGINPIREKFLQPNYLMALGYFEGWIFGRVIKRRICQYKPWPLIDSNGNSIDVSENSYATQGNLRFVDTRNTQRDILYLDNETDSGFAWLLHGAIGIKPQQMNMYLRFPETQNIPGKFPNIDPIVPAAGDNTGYVNGTLSPYEEPTDAAELVLPPKQHVSAEYFNKDSGPGVWNHQPVMNLLFAVYWFQPLNPVTHAGLVSRIARREIPAAYLPIGVGDFSLNFGKDFEVSWGVTPMTLEEAAGLGGGPRGGRF